MNLSEISIRNSVFAWMLMAGLILFGWIGFHRLGVSEMPDVDFPVVNVDLTLEGAAPEVMETDVVDIVEDALTTVQGIREISSTSKQGSASITVEFDLDRDIDAALQEVQTKIAQATRRLPDDLDPPVVTKNNPEDQPIMWVGVLGDVPLRELMEYTRDHVKDQFQTVRGVGEVFLGGFLEPNLRIWLDTTKLQEWELTPQDVVNAIRRQHVEKPAGRLETDTKETNIRVYGEALSTEEFENILILERGGGAVYKPVRLKDVATIEKGLSDFRRISRVDGKTAIGLGIRKQRGANAVEVAKAVRAKVVEMDPTMPQGMHVRINFDSTRFIEDSMGELVFMLLLSALATGLVCWLFLGSWSATFNVLLAIPTSIVGTFMVLYFAGFTLNNFTLLGLVLAIGIVVDDAIMVLENIVRYQQGGMGKVQAALTGAKQITFSALAASLAIVAIFLPVAFMKGIIGKFFFQFGVTMSVAVGLSLLEALTLTPMRCSQFVALHSKKGFQARVEGFFERLSARYRKSLEWCLAHRLQVIAASLVFFIASMACLPLVKKEFVPAQDQSMFLVRLQTPVGSSMAFTDSRFKVAEEKVSARLEVLRYFAAIGGFGGGDVNSGMLFITLKPKSERKTSQKEMMAWAREELNKIPDVKAFVQDLSTRGFTAQRGFPVEFTVRGPNWEKLTQISQEFVARMKASPYFVDVDTNFQENMPELSLVPDREKTMSAGVDLDALSSTIQIAMGGLVAGSFKENGRRSDVRVRLQESDRLTAEGLKNLFVRNIHGELMAVQNLVRIDDRKTLLSITRKNRERAIGIYSNIGPGKSQAQALSEVNDLTKKLLPPGYRLVLSGSAETFKESFQSLIFAFWVGLAVAYMILASQFNSFIHPFTVLLALPFSLSGAFLALLLGGFSLNIYSMIGLLLLMGIVKKNSILLVDFTNQMRAEKSSVAEALLIACPIRLRPILMTSLATIAAAIPPALGIGPGAETRIPMAVAVVGGVLVSTFLTLYVVPVAYSLFARFERKTYRHPAT